MPNRKIAPEIRDAIDFDFNLPDCGQLILPNGVPLYHLAAGTQDVVQVNWVFRAGIWQENQTGVAQSVAALLKNGTSTKSAYEISSTIEYYGAELKAAANNDYATLSLYTLTKHLPSLLPLAYEILTDAAFSEEELGIYQQNTLQRLNINLLKSEFIANRLIDKHLFGQEYPYGKYTEPADIAALTTEALRNFQKAHYTSGNCTLFLSGNFSPADVEQIGRLFGDTDWNGGRQPDLHDHLPQPSGQKKIRATNKEENVQGAIRLARHLPAMQHPDFIPLSILNTIFGGYFGSRLMANIREEKGYTYGIHSSIFGFRHNTEWVVSTEAGKEVCEAAIIEIYKEMERLQREPVNDGELLLVKNYLLGNLLGDLDGPFQIMQKWRGLILNGFDKSRFEQSIRTYKTITPGHLQELAQRYLNPEDFYELLVI